jgi:hypothetical protein
MAYYDEELKAAVFKLESHGQPLGEGAEITVAVHSILTGVEHFDRLDTGLSLADIMRAAPEPALMDTREPAPAGGPAQTNADAGGPAQAAGLAGGRQPAAFGVAYGDDPAAAEFLLEQYQDGRLPILAPQARPVALENTGWLELTAAGVVENFLHLQYRAATDAGRYGRTEFYLTWPGAPGASREYRLAAAEMGLGGTEQVGAWQLSESYETILELPAGAPAEEVRLMMSGTRCALRVEGDWSVSFVPDASPPVYTTGCHIRLGELVINRVMLSPIALTAYGRGTHTADTPSITMRVTLKDGTVILPESAYSSMDLQNGTYLIQNSFSRPINLDEVGRLTINGQDIPLDGYGV